MHSRVAFVVIFCYSYTTMTNFPLSSSRNAGDVLFVSGQIGQQNGQLVSDKFEDQVNQAINNIKVILEQNKMDLKNVVDVTVFLVDSDDYSSFNEVYAKNFSEPYPARTTVTVKSLPLGAKVELKAIASKK